MKVRSGAARRSPLILVVDDDLVQSKLWRIRLEGAGFRVATARGAEEAMASMRVEVPDGVMSDVVMGGLDGFGFCRRLRQEPRFADIPVLLMSAHYREDEGRALAARVGANGIVERTPDGDAELAALHACLEAAGRAHPEVVDGGLLEQHLVHNAGHVARLVGEAQRANDRWRLLFENATDGIVILSPAGVILEANVRWQALIGVPPERMIGRSLVAFAPPGHEASNLALFRALVLAGEGRVQAPVLRADGATILLEFSVTVVAVDGEPTILVIAHDVTEAVRATRALIAAEEKYRSLVERIPDVIWTGDLEGRVTFITQNIAQVTGYAAGETLATSFAERLEQIHPDDRARVVAAREALARDGRPFDIEYQRRHKEGHWVWVRNRAFFGRAPDGTPQMEGIITDVTERRRFEEGLRQAQKMEALGQLTGGIAHDFNNILAAILANCHFLIEDLGPSDPRCADALEIRLAAERATALTRQLLAFGRRQLLEPTVVDLNTTVLGVRAMLVRLLGEDVRLAVSLPEPSCPVRVDVGQIEQVIVNLVVNARDAMPGGGLLTIETANVEAADMYSAEDAPVRPGSYVMLAVSDTGCGMSPEVRRRIFEPFFTTKEVGRGTGLGMSTSFGIVKQSGGHILVYSEPGRGTTVKVFLPRVAGAAAGEGVPAAAAPPRGGGEMVLLIEDDAPVRVATSRILESWGYRVIAAESGAEAMRIVERADTRIDLLLSDVVMPGALGPEAVARVRAHLGPIKALFMSGYTDHAAIRSRSLQVGVDFIQKPFSPEYLARKVREVLDG